MFCAFILNNYVFGLKKKKTNLHRKRDGELVKINPERMEGGDVDSIALKIRDVTRSDLGNYTCELQNDFGIGVSSNIISVNVHCK